MAIETSDRIGEPARKQYVPSSERSGFALCLSGGGYRAALFHCGAARRLNELGILGKVDEISAVSGGSIFAALLAQRIPSMKGGKFEDYEGTIADPLRNLVKNDIRTCPALRRLLPWEWANGAAQVEGLQQKYEELLCPKMRLQDLPQRPAFHFCSTDLAFGVNWVFSRTDAGDWQAGHMSAVAAGNVPLARAVAASSCFPPVFRPMPLHLQGKDLPEIGAVPEGADREKCVEAISLSDGGVYDNLGLEPVWKHCSTLLVSDGGKPFRVSKSTDTLHLMLRILDVVQDQAEAVRKRWLIASYINQVYTGAYWGIGSCVADYPVPNAPPVGLPGYSNDLVKNVISTIRTDMDEFSDAEIAILENHGYCLVEAAIKAHAAHLDNGCELCPAENKYWPDPKSLESVERQVRQDLAGSDQIKIFGH